MFLDQEMSAQTLLREESSKYTKHWLVKEAVDLKRLNSSAQAEPLGGLCELEFEKNMLVEWI